MSQSFRPPAAAVRSRLALYVTAAVYVVLAIRQQAFVARYAVDVMYWDSWDLYQPMFRGLGWWATFDQQHGPHRQGLGGLLIRAMAPRTRWDTRYDAMAVSWALIAAAPLAVLLAWRCGVRGWPLVAVPVVYLNARQYQMLVASANPAHGALPVLLITVLGLAWFVQRTAVRLALIVGLTFCCIFTGFGIFVGLVTPTLLTIECAQAIRSGDRRRAAAVGAALAGTAAAWAAFAVGYRFDPASDRFQFPFERPVEYLYFIGTMLGNYVGVKGAAQDPGWGSITIGLGIAAAGIGVAVTRGARLVARGVVNDRGSAAIFLMSAFGVLFVAQAAIGRTPEGWRTGAYSRYVTLCIPIGLALLIHLATIGLRLGRWSAVVFGGLLAAGTVTLYADDVTNVEWAYNGCLHWRAAYLVTHDATEANRITGFGLYPRPTDGSRLRYLESHKLNMFDPAAYGPTSSGPAGGTVTPRGTGGR